MEQQTTDDQSPRSTVLVPQLTKELALHLGYLQDEAKANTQAKRSARFCPLSSPIHTTLLDLVRAVNEGIDDDQVVATTIAQLVNSGHVRLIGTFKHTPMIIL